MKKLHDMSDVCLILQGEASSKEQLLATVKKYYMKCNIKNIIISSYSEYIDEELKKYAKLVENDKYGELKIKNGEKVITSYNKNELILGIHPYSKLYWDMLTIERGVRCANKSFPKCKYYLKLNADIIFLNIIKMLNKWRRMGFGVADKKFERKLIIKKNNMPKSEIKRVDHVLFGTKKDVNKYYNFNKNTLLKGHIWNYITENELSETKEIPLKYFYIEKDMRLAWKKYELKGKW